MAIKVEKYAYGNIVKRWIFEEEKLISVRWQALNKQTTKVSNLGWMMHTRMRVLVSLKATRGLSLVLLLLFVSFFATLFPLSIILFWWAFQSMYICCLLKIKSDFIKLCYHFRTKKLTFFISEGHFNLLFHIHVLAVCCTVLEHFCD